MPGMDVFDANVFSMRSLTAAIEEEPYVPGQVSSLGLFGEDGVTTTAISIERQAASLALVPTSARGGPGTPNVDDKRSMIDLTVPHLELVDHILADEVQGVRGFGSETALMALQSKVNGKTTRMARNLDATSEWHRLGAIKGQVLDADGTTVLFDYFTATGETGIATQSLDFAADIDGALRTKIATATRLMANAIGGLPWSRVHALCGPDFFDGLVGAAEVRQSFLVSEGAALRERQAYTTLNFGGITWEEYRGSPGGIADDEAQAFPVGVPDLFITRYAPADTFEAVNTMGRPRYASQRPDGTNPEKRRVIEVQTNPIHICTRPRVLVKFASV